MTPQEYEQQRFYHRANNALDAAEAAAYVGLAWAWWQQGAAQRAASKAQHGPMPTPLKAWFGTMAACLGMAAVLFFVEAGSQSTEDYIRGENSPSHVWSIIFLVLAVLCFLGAIVHAGWHDWSVRNDPPPPAAPARPMPRDWPPRPTPPPVTQTRVERSVRVVWAQATTTPHHNSQAPTAALESPHKDVERSSGLVVIRESHRPTLWTEDHDGRRTRDRRSFDRDIGAV